MREVAERESSSAQDVTRGFSGIQEIGVNDGTEQPGRSVFYTTFELTS